MEIAACSLVIENLDAGPAKKPSKRKGFVSIEGVSIEIGKVSLGIPSRLLKRKLHVKRVTVNDLKGKVRINLLRRVGVTNLF